MRPKQQIVADAAHALGSSRSSWFFEALLERATREDHQRAFDVIFEAEAGMHAICPKCHRGVPFPTLGGGSMAGLPFTFLGEYEKCAKGATKKAEEGQCTEIF